jgi:hypothetical protein
MGSLSVVVVWCKVVRNQTRPLVYLPSLTKSSATKSDVTHLVSRKADVVCIDGYQTGKHVLIHLLKPRQTLTCHILEANVYFITGFGCYNFLV